MTWSTKLTRLRRFLRDPDGNIWNDAIILAEFNTAQRNLQRQTNFLENAQPVHVPPFYEFSYIQDWEWPFLDSGSGNYQALNYHQQADFAFCHLWEPQQIWGQVPATAVDEGTHFTHPFEAWYCSVASSVVPFQLPRGFQKARLVAWDKEPIDALDLKGIQGDDSSWLTRMGEPEGYWRPDKLEDQFFLYPLPSTVVWQDYISEPQDALVVYSSSFESEYATGGNTWIFTREDATDAINYVFNWELDNGSAPDEVFMRGMWLHEIDSTSATISIGQITIDSDYTMSSETGTIVDFAGLLSSEYGIATDIIEADDNVLFVYSMTTTDIADTRDESDWPDYLQKYAEYGALEALYSANTDGQIQSLRDYWKMRKEMGVKAIQVLSSLRKQDRDYCLSTQGSYNVARNRRDPKLPSSYPAVWR